MDTLEIKEINDILFNEGISYKLDKTTTDIDQLFRMRCVCHKIRCDKVSMTNKKPDSPEITLPSYEYIDKLESSVKKKIQSKVETKKPNTRLTNQLKILILH